MKIWRYENPKNLEVYIKVERYENSKIWIFEDCTNLEYFLQYVLKCIVPILYCNTLYYKCFIIFF